MSRTKFEAILSGVGFAATLGLIAGWTHPLGLPFASAAALGVAVGALVILLGLRARQATAENLVAGFVGCVAGIGLGLLLVFVCTQAGLGDGAAARFLRIAIPLAGAYLGLAAGIANAGGLPVNVTGATRTKSTNLGKKILDTSVLIDGRIADIAESGFLEGRLIVPRFVLHELQLVADSSDSAKRNRGRRGLDVVQLLQKQAHAEIEVSSEDFPEVREVDLKLIELAKRHGAKIVTNDFNLNKLAQVQGLAVMNINELANSLKPVVLPGETMRVYILKEGKEYNQGVAYLDDGTMVVVDNARRMISKTVDIVVTSVLQTTAGKMIFGRFDERQEPRANATAASTAAQ